MNDFDPTDYDQGLDEDYGLFDEDHTWWERDPGSDHGGAAYHAHMRAIRGRDD